METSLKAVSNACNAFERFSSFKRSRKLFLMTSFSLFSFKRSRLKLNRETKNVSRHACNLRLMETSLYGIKVVVGLARNGKMIMVIISNCGIDDVITTSKESNTPPLHFFGCASDKMSLFTFSYSRTLNLV